MRFLVFAAVGIMVASAGLARAEGVPDAAELAARNAKRFPQAITVGALTGRKVLQPIEAQPVLGQVAGVGRRADGQLDMLVKVGGFAGLGGRVVAVPIEAMAVMGEYVAAVDVPPAVLAALPASAPETALPPAEVVKLGIVKPFH